MGTTGHYDEITKIQQFRNDQLERLRDRVRRRQQESKRPVSQDTKPSANELRKTTARKSPAGHH